MDLPVAGLGNVSWRTDLAAGAAAGALGHKNCMP